MPSSGGYEMHKNYSAGIEDDRIPSHLGQHKKCNTAKSTKSNSFVGKTEDLNQLLASMQ